MERNQYKVVPGEDVPAPKASGVDAQTVTFVLSLVVQLGVLIFSLVTLRRGSLPSVLMLVLVLETVVQGLEFLWYLGLAIALLCDRKLSVGVWVRYLDWAFTTPVMLITLYFFLIYLDENCTTLPQLRAEPHFAGFLALIVLFDWLMLFLGFMYERDLFGVRDGKYKQWPLLAGFVPLVVAFTPHIYTLAHSYTGIGLASVIITFFLWSIYGIISICYFDDSKARNAAFNILDLASKNAAGIVVSIVAINFDSDSC